mmetsp:Transcript_4682/g.5016  ORF Transcript_4682/g.5016 Transcript_4682/m.5016 type:complete len:450 (+) Transcript_4682:66-1415(+)
MDNTNTFIRHIEVAVVSAVPLSILSDLRNRFELFLSQKKFEDQFPGGKDGEIDIKILPNELHPQHPCRLVNVRIVDDNEDAQCFSSTFIYKVHTYELSNEEISTEEIDPSASGGDDEWVAGCDNLVLPHVSLHGVWESLIFDCNVKKQLLAYAQSAILFSDKEVSPHVVQWNRILLLHGPPGTGKTSLNKGLAQKLAIRLSTRFPRSTLLEIHSHSLFSKWFSTSGKLVSALFSMVRDMVEDDPHCLVCVLIDEIESLASSRSQQQGGDPSDAMRAVNSLLTSLDRLKSFPNVMVLATTNLTGQIDAAFVDRVDLKLHINVPIFRARYEILRTCVEELVRVGIVVGLRKNVADNSSVAMSTEYASKELFVDFIVAEKEEREQIDGDESGMLLSCSRDADGLSGRSLRRLPLQAHTQFLSSRNDGGLSLKSFLLALSLAIQSEQKARLEV